MDGSASTWHFNHFFLSCSSRRQYLTRHFITLDQTQTPPYQSTVHIDILPIKDACRFFSSYNMLDMYVCTTSAFYQLISRICKQTKNIPRQIYFLFVFCFVLHPRLTWSMFNVYLVVSICMFIELCPNRMDGDPSEALKWRKSVHIIYIIKQLNDDGCHMHEWLINAIWTAEIALWIDQGSLNSARTSFVGKMVSLLIWFI